MKTKKRVTEFMAALVLAAIPMTMDAQPRISFRLEFGEPPVDRYYVSLGEYHNVPYRDICLMHDAGVVDEDMPLILYIYTHSQYSLRQIYTLRLRGATWENLSNWCGVPLYGNRTSPPYGNAYGYYGHGPARQWNEPGLREGEGEGHHDRLWREERGGGWYREERGREGDN